MVIGKEQLCSIDLKYFKSVQAVGGKTLFDRYQLAEKNIINAHIDAKYQNFLAYPAKSGDSITFHGKKYSESPQLLSELQGDDLDRYAKIKEETLAHYNSKISSLRDSGKITDAEFLSGAIKYVDDRFVYCYDGIVVLGVWGMQVRDVKEDVGVICKNLVVKKKKAPVQEPPPSPPPPPPPPVSPPKPPRKPWLKKILKWLLALLLLLLLLFLLCWLLRGCDDHGSLPGIYNPGKPYTPKPTPPGYENVLPPNQGVLPPVDKRRIIHDPGMPPIVGNRLNILMENEDKSIMDLAIDFKAKYPDSSYKVVYYDDVVKRLQIEFPPTERETLKKEIPPKFAPKYTLFVYDETLFETRFVPNDPAYLDQQKAWYLHSVRAPQAWVITRGSPKHTIAIVDNGFSLEHPELKSKVVMPYNVWLHSNKVFPQNPDHGTHVAGTALAIANNKEGLLGIAPNCAFMPIQIADAQGIMTTTSILDGILYALYQGANVVNVSLGMNFSKYSASPEQFQRDMINTRFKEEERLWNKITQIAEKRKAIIVSAAGNNNVLAGISPLQRPENVITVSTLDKQNKPFKKADFSNYGEHTTISAPGVDIYSSVGNDGYTMMTGTSMAAPIVAGGVALIKDLNDSLTAKEIICVLQSTGLYTEKNIGRLIQLDKALEAVKNGKITCEASKPPATKPPPGVAKCNTAVSASGGDEGYKGNFYMGQNSGSFVFRYDTYKVPDKITIYDGPDLKGRVIFSYSGGTGRKVNTTVNFNVPVISVEVKSLGSGTSWDFEVNCPGGASR